jgi:tRNA dimethylallyltransferase
MTSVALQGLVEYTCALLQGDLQPMPDLGLLMRVPQHSEDLSEQAVNPSQALAVVEAQAKPPVFFLMGPTASGKTALAIELVARLPLEIISVDSAMIYRGMDIGTAKPTPAELARAPHHLLDIRDPTDYYSAGAFVKDATRLIAEIQARGKQALLVGGTMLYFKALQAGLSPLPEQDPATRARLDERAASVGWPALHAELAGIDPEAAAKIKPTDSQRIQRALEVFYLSGKPLTAWHHEQTVPDLNAIALGFLPEDRQILHRRIETRVDAMLHAGWIDEVLALRQRYPLTAEMPAMRAVGYRQIFAMLEGQLSLAELRDRIVFATRQYAKRQITWLKVWPHLQVLEGVA